METKKPRNLRTLLNKNRIIVPEENIRWTGEETFYTEEEVAKSRTFRDLLTGDEVKGEKGIPF